MPAQLRLPDSECTDRTNWQFSSAHFSSFSRFACALKAERNSLKEKIATSEAQG